MMAVLEPHERGLLDVEVTFISENAHAYTTLDEPVLSVGTAFGKNCPGGYKRNDHSLSVAGQPE